MSKKKNSHFLRIKEAVQDSKKITNHEKALAVQKIEEWYLEDKAMNLLEEQLFNISKEIKPILSELGLL